MERPDSAKLVRLPRWAQTYIARLEEECMEARKEAALKNGTMTDKTRVMIGTPYQAPGLPRPVPLGNDADVTFRGAVPDENRWLITVSLTRPRLDGVRVYSPTGRTLVVPESSNVIVVAPERW